MIHTVNSDGPDFRALLSGVIGDYGRAVIVYPDGKVDPEHNSEMALELTQRSFRLDIAGLDNTLVEAASHEPIYPATCSDFFGFTTAVPIVAGSGTGSYCRIAGSFTVTVDEVEPKGCTREHRPPLWQQVIMLAGPGTVPA